MTITARAWLVIAHGGGRWSAADVQEKLPQAKPNTIAGALLHMSTNGCLQFYEPSGSEWRQRFGVTLDCRVPQGVERWEVLEALGLPVPPEAYEAPSSKGMKLRDVMRSAQGAAA